MIIFEGLLWFRRRVDAFGMEWLVLSFQIPKGLSNYERAVIERQLSRFKLRDLRGNANPYWKQDHSSSTVKHIRTYVGYSK